MSRKLTCHPAKLATVVSVLLLLAGSLSSCEVAKKNAPKYGGTYRYCCGEIVTTFDPAYCSWGGDIETARLIYSTLVHFDRDTLKIEPDLARDWKFSKDGKTWTFYLRRGVKFHNRGKATADDFVYSFTRLVDPKLDTAAAYVFEQVEGVADFQEGRTDHVKGFKALDKYTFQIRLTQPLSPFLSMLTLANTAVVPKEAVQAKGGLEKHPVGTGAFKFKKYVKDKYVLLEANRDYYAGRPYLDKVKLVLFPGGSYSKVIEEFKKGNLEQSYILQETFKDAKRVKKSFLKRTPPMDTEFFILKTTTPPFNNKKVRQAFSQIINRKKLIVQLGTSEIKEVAHSLIPPGIAGRNPYLRINEYEPKNSETLLENAGYPKGQGLPAIHLYCCYSEMMIALRQIKKDGERVGFKIAIHKVSNEILNQLAEDDKSNFAGAFMTWWADYDDPDNFLFSISHSKSFHNTSRYSNPQVDNLIAQARAIPDPASKKRIKLYQEAEKIVLEDAPVVPVSHNSNFYLIQPYVRGLSLNDIGEGTYNFQKIWLEKH